MTGRLRAALVLCVIGTVALALLVAVSMAGGFSIEIGPVHLSVHNLRSPSVVAVLAWVGAVWLAGTSGLARTLASIGEAIDTRACSAALVAAGVAAGIGLAFGTYSASGADAAGYVSQSRLLAGGQIVSYEPLATMVDWPYATDAFSPLGYRPGMRPGEIVPTYPPGLPLLMAGSRWVGGEWAPFVVVPLLGALTVLCTYRLGALLQTASAGAVAAVLMATSPVFLFQVVQPMSDVAATAFWALSSVLALTGRPASAGAAAGIAALVRPNLAPLWLAVGLSCLRPRLTASQQVTPTPPAGSDVEGHCEASGWFPGARAPLTSWLVFGATFALGVAVLASFQGALYGNPLGSGHGSVSDLFAPGNIASNVRDYASRIWRGETPALALAVASAALLLVTRPSARSALALSATARPLIVVMAVLLASYLPYGVFPDWSYLRFLMPGFPFAFVAVGALVTAASTRLPAPARGLAMILTLVAAASVNVTIARREQAFNLHRYEGRYRTTGRYLEAVLPSSAVIVTSQESTAAQYYTGRPVLHWDLLFADLDAAVATLQSMGRTPVLVVEDWEMPTLRGRFPTSALARMDWLPRAEIGETTRVRLFDPTDRARTDVVTDRIR